MIFRHSALRPHDGSQPILRQKLKGGLVVARQYFGFLRHRQFNPCDFFLQGLEPRPSRCSSRPRGQEGPSSAVSKDPARLGPEAICSTPVDLDQSSQSIGGFSRSPHSLGQRSLALAGNELLEQRTWTKFLPRMIRERLPESCLSNDSGE